MRAANIPDNEEERLKALQSLEILDTSPEEDFDRITCLATKVFNVPISLVSLVDTSRQWFKSKTGLEACETSREVAFCSHAILGDDVFIVEDSTKDERFSDNPLVTGEPKVIFYAGIPLSTTSGHKIGTLCLIDHTPRKFPKEKKEILIEMGKQVERFLQIRMDYLKINEREEKFRAMYENSPDAYLIMETGDGKITDCNSAAEKMLRGTKDEILSTTPDQLSPEFQANGKSSLDMVAVKMDQILRDGKARFNWLHRRLDGELFPCDVNISLINIEGRTVLLVGWRDMTVQKQLENELLRSNRELEQFAYVASHDLKAPLAHITGYVSLLEDEYRDDLAEDAKKYLERIQIATTRLQHLITSLLSYSSIERKEIKLTKVALSEIISELESVFETELIEKSGSIQYSNLPIIKGDEVLVSQVFQNLISNSLKFTKDGISPKITIDSKEENNRVIITFKDNGIGFNDEKHKEKIFQVFQRLHAKDAYEGTGIGLSICRQVMEKMGGLLTLDLKKDRVLNLL